MANIQYLGKTIEFRHYLNSIGTITSVPINNALKQPKSMMMAKDTAKEAINGKATH